jgi:hypothetical protein
MFNSKDTMTNIKSLGREHKKKTSQLYLDTHHGKLVIFSSYEYQGTQSKNSFNSILSFDFNLRCLKMYTYYIRWSQFCKDYQKDSYNKIIFIVKNIDDKKKIATIKKHS